MDAAGDMHIFGEPVYSTRPKERRTYSDDCRSAGAVPVTIRIVGEKHLKILKEVFEFLEFEVVRSSRSGSKRYPLATITRATGLLEKVRLEIGAT
jgi:hypothetical protein